MKQIEVQIMGASYVLGCKEGAQEALLQAVRMVDEHMCKIRDTGKTKARERVAVLAALNITAELNEQKALLQAQINSAQNEHILLATPSTPTEPPQNKSKLKDGSEANTILHTASDAELDDLLNRVDGVLGIAPEGRLF